MTDIELSLTGMAHGGSAVGRAEGKAVFVPYAITGEQIRARIVQDKGRFAEAELLEVLESSPHRVQPRCIHFGVCGGCHWQHIDYAAQIEFKRQIVHDHMTRIGGFKDLTVQPTLPSPDPWYYRSHVTLHTTPEGQLGFVSADQQMVIPIQECHIMRPELFAMLQNALENSRLQVGNTGEDRAEKVLYRVKDHLFQVTAGSFFQVNIPQAETLVSLVMENLQLQGSERVLDLY
ncbi:MAG: TRAM domain-containing protein, partial [Anaerolineae bacterium]|nr:TRAM domain-containing protein [Anaerolineae bacterium]